MKHVLSNPYHEVIRFDAGGRIVEELKKFVEGEKIRAGWIWMLGSAKAVEMSYYDLAKKEYIKKIFEEPLEVLDIHGNIAKKDSEVVLHLHGSFSRTDFSTVGGHIHEMETSGTMEVFIHKIEGTLTRAQDASTGLNVLQ